MRSLLRIVPLLFLSAAPVPNTYTSLTKENVDNLRPRTINVHEWNHIVNNLDTLHGMQGSVGVQAYGAVGDNTHNDTSAIQEAVTAATAIGANVYFPRGTYKVTDTIVLSGSQTHFTGENGGYPYGAILSGALTTTAAFDYTNPKPVLWLKNCYGCVVENIGIVIPGGYHAAEAVRITTQTGGGGGSYSTRNVFKHFGASGINHNELEVGVRIGGLFGINMRTGGGTGLVAGAVDGNNDFHSFEDCTFANYGNVGIYIEDSQVFQIMLWNTFFQPNGFQTSATGAITSSSTSLTTASGLFTAEDVGKVIEVTGAGTAGAIHRSRISAITDLTHVALVNAAATTVGPTATITYGAQSAIYANKGGFSMYGGGAGSAMSEDYYIGVEQPSTILINGVINEGSRRFIATAGPSGLTKHVVVQNTRFAGNSVIACSPAQTPGPLGNDCKAISFVGGGGLSIENSEIGDPEVNTSTPIQISVGSFTQDSTWSQHATFTLSNSGVNSSLAIASVFPGEKPMLVGKNRFTPQGAVKFFGEVARVIPSNGSTVSGAQTMYLGAGQVFGMTINGSTTLTLEDLPVGIGTPVYLVITHTAGPHTITWPAGTLSTGDVGTATAGKKDIFEIRYDGTNYYKFGRLGYQ